MKIADERRRQFPGTGLFLGLALLWLSGCLPQTIEGQWEVKCHPASDDCPNMTIFFAHNGDIIEVDVDGVPQQAVQGSGSIEGDVLHFIVNDVYEYTGKLKPFRPEGNGSLKELEKLKKNGDPSRLQDHLPAVAQGTMDDHDADGDDVFTRATVRRIGPLKPS